MLLRSLRYARKASYSEDGMTTVHVADFLTDRRFQASYEKGEQTGSWNGSQLRWRVYTCCWAAAHALALAGDFVECGVNRGGTARAVIEYTNFSATDRTFFLLDTLRVIRTLRRSINRNILSAMKKPLRPLSNSAMSNLFAEEFPKLCRPSPHKPLRICRSI